MKVWTIHPLEAWEDMQRTGVLRCREDKIYAADFLPAYEWIAYQMCQKVGKPPPGVHYPVWVWARYDGIARPRPDLRSQRFRWKTGEQAVMLECDLPESDVLLSDFDGWTFGVLPHPSYIASSEADSARFDELWGRLVRFNPTIEYMLALEQSWHRIFDLEFAYQAGWRCPPAERAVQGTVWEIPLAAVRKVTPFAGARPANGAAV